MSVQCTLGAGLGGPVQFILHTGPGLTCYATAPVVFSRCVWVCVCARLRLSQIEGHVTELRSCDDEERKHRRGKETRRQRSVRRGGVLKEPPLLLQRGKEAHEETPEETRKETNEDTLKEKHEGDERGAAAGIKPGSSTSNPDVRPGWGSARPNQD